jgi:choline-glycine betaine transporter
MSCLLLAVLEWAPASRDYFDWFWLLVLGIAALLSLAVRRLDTVSVVVGLAFLLASVLMVLRFTRYLSSDAVDLSVPLPVIGIGALALFVQRSAISPLTPDNARTSS